MTITGLVLAFASSPATAAPAGPVLDRALTKRLQAQSVPITSTHHQVPPVTVKSDGSHGIGTRIATVCPAQGTAPPNDSCYQYDRVGEIWTGTNGAGSFSANISVAKPYKDSNWSYHTLMELALQSPGGNQTVEVGWTVAGDTGSDHPRFFAFNWKNAHGRIYSYGAGSDWIAVTGCTVCTGAGAAGDLSADIGTVQAFGITHLSSPVAGWYVSYKGIFQAALPDTFYTCNGCNTGTGTWDTPVTFVRAPQGQAFSELASAESVPVTTSDAAGAPAADNNTLTTCTDMGNGINPRVDPTNSARLSSLHFADIDPAGSMDDNWLASAVQELQDNPGAPSTPGQHWGAVGIPNGVGTFVSGVRVGGPGYGSRGSWTTNGWKDSCGPTAEGTPLASGIQAWLEPVTGDATGLKGNTNAWSHAWSTAVINSCNSVSGDPVQDSWRVWNNSLSSGKAFKVYATSTCGSTSALVTNASKVVTGWPIHAWARVS